jgi:hypothetical protein
VLPERVVPGHLVVFRPDASAKLLRGNRGTVSSDLGRDVGEQLAKPTATRVGVHRLVPIRAVLYRRKAERQIDTLKPIALAAACRELFRNGGDDIGIRDDFHNGQRI